MKQLTEKRQHIGINGWGAESITERQAFIVEASDVGRTYDHYLGLNHKSYTFRSTDMNRTIERITDGCWYFGSIFSDVSNNLVKVDGRKD